MPGTDGLDAMPGDSPFFRHPIIVMVTAKIEEIDRLLALEIGADDYICKPLQPARSRGPRENHILRRCKPQRDPSSRMPKAC